MKKLCQSYNNPYKNRHEKKFYEKFMTNSGHIIFDQQEEVIFGQPAAIAFVARKGVSRVFLMVSGSLNRNTDEIEKIRAALGKRYVGTFDAMPAHTSRQAVIAAASQARDIKAHGWSQSGSTVFGQRCHYDRRY